MSNRNLTPRLLELMSYGSHRAARRHRRAVLLRVPPHMVLFQNRARSATFLRFTLSHVLVHFIMVLQAHFSWQFCSFHGSRESPLFSAMPDNSSNPLLYVVRYSSFAMPSRKTVGSRSASNFLTDRRMLVPTATPVIIVTRHHVHMTVCESRWSLR